MSNVSDLAYIQNIEIKSPATLAPHHRESFRDATGASRLHTFRNLTKRRAVVVPRSATVSGRGNIALNAVTHLVREGAAREKVARRHSIL